jgi:hypothetical protein
MGATVEIKVINNNAGLTLRGRYDGKDYVFAPGKSVNIDIEAAKHIFGLGEDDKSGALNKLGLLIPGRHTLEDALEKLDKISFLEGRTVFADEEGFAEEEQPRKRTGGRPHVSVPGGDSGAGSQESASGDSG